MAFAAVSRSDWEMYRGEQKHATAGRTPDRETGREKNFEEVLVGIYIGTSTTTYTYTTTQMVRRAVEDVSKMSSPRDLIHDAAEQFVSYLFLGRERRKKKFIGRQRVVYGRGWGLNANGV